MCWFFCFTAHVCVCTSLLLAHIFISTTLFPPYTFFLYTSPPSIYQSFDHLSALHMHSFVLLSALHMHSCSPSGKVALIPLPRKTLSAAPVNGTVQYYIFYKSKLPVELPSQHEELASLMTSQMPLVTCRVTILCYPDGPVIHKYFSNTANYYFRTTSVSNTANYYFNK